MPIYREVQSVIKDGQIGEVKAAVVTFGTDALKSVERVMDPNLGGSVLMDIGLYAVNFADIAFSGQSPDQISAIGCSAESGVDLTSGMTFLYKGGGMAQLLVSGGKQHNLLLQTHQ